MMNVYYCVHCGCSLYLHVSAYPVLTQNPAACPGLVLLKIPAVNPCLLLLVLVHSPFLSHPSQPLQRSENKRKDCITNIMTDVICQANDIR